jgi:hypothetical protein
MRTLRFGSRLGLPQIDENRGGVVVHGAQIDVPVFGHLISPALRYLRMLTVVIFRIRRQVPRTMNRKSPAQAGFLIAVCDGSCVDSA